MAAGEIKTPPMPHKRFSNANLHATLYALDTEITTIFQETGCQHCKSRLDVSHDPRKPRDVPETFRHLYAQPLSVRRS